MLLAHTHHRCMTRSVRCHRIARIQRGTAGDAQGFTLLEVLVAFIITALAVSLMVGTTSDAMRSTRKAARYQEATLRAQSRLAAAADAGKPRLGEREGDDGGGFRWHERVVILRTDGGQASGRAAALVSLYGIRVWISWHDGIAAQTVTLETERVAPSP